MIIDNLFTNLYPKYKTETLKTLLLTNLAKQNLKIKLYQLKRLFEFKVKFPMLLDTMTLMKVNKNLSYLSFILKEFFEFISCKFDEMKNLQIECNHHLDIINRINTIH